ncbi:MAG: hypothetical protein GEV08_25205 [Acidimicrobiia bacterium]|nr:hypothetical protein [Acidimicrobiia bacterium]
MSRGTGRTKRCGTEDAARRLEDARQFLEVAERTTAPGYGDVVATNAIHAAIAAADVICCLRLGRRSNDGNHRVAVDLLRQVDAQLANHLRRALDHKQQAAYESRDLSDRDAAACVEQARRLYRSAQEAVAGKRPRAT